MRLLLCTDGSPAGQEAVRFGALLARSVDEPPTLVAVAEHPAEMKQAERAIEEGKEWLAAGPAPTVKIRRGDAAKEILDEARSGAYDLVIVGGRGRRGLTRLLMGSTAERIARQAGLPVLIVRGQRQAINRVLICTGGSAPGLEAVEFGGWIARLAGAKATVLHVMSQIPASPVAGEEGRALDAISRMPTMPSLAEEHLEDLEASAEDLIAEKAREGLHLAQALRILAKMDVEAKALVRHGLVVDEVAAEACGADYDLVVVGAHPATGWMHWLLDDVSQKIMHCCLDRPILVVKS